MPVLGYFIVLFASFIFCFQNVIVRVLFNEHTILGMLQTGGFVEPTLQNSFLLLFMRALLALPLIAGMATKLYPPIWQEIRKLVRFKTKPDQRSLGYALITGSLMFLYLALLYLSIGLIPTGIALTLFFTYPLFAALLSWGLFGDRPSRLRWIVMAVVLLGSALTVPYGENAIHNFSWLGVAFGIGSSLAHAFYVVSVQKSLETLHPVSLTWMSFATTLALSVLSLGVSLWVAQGIVGAIDPSGSTVLERTQGTPLNWTGLWIGGLLSAIATGSGHLILNFGIRQIGATAASMISSSNPALTVVLAWLTIQETLNQIQVLGVLLVTLSVASLSREHP